MDDQSLLKLRQYYHSLKAQEENLKTFHAPNIEHYAVIVLKDELERVSLDFPDLCDKGYLNKFHSHRASDGVDYYNVKGIKAYMGSLLGKIKILIDSPNQGSIIEKKEFDFVNNPELRRILERDYQEIQKSFVSGCWKSVIVLCGGAIEAILTDIIAKDTSKALSASNAPKEKDITRWSLNNLIAVSYELGFISSGVGSFSHSLKDYRNLVHPGRELREKLTFDSEEAKIAVEVFNIIYRDLSK